MRLLDKGSLLKHRRLGYIVRINDIQRGNYVLGWVEQPEQRIQNFLLKGPWTAVDLVRAFIPQIQSSRWDLLMEGGLVTDDDPQG